MIATTQASIDRIRAFARENRISKSRLARLAGLRDTVLRDFWEDDWNPRLETLRKVEAVVPEDFRTPSGGGGER